jgi:iron complex transport system substrate-binding protein
MGAGDHLVAVSNYDDTQREGLRGLPKVGDYQAIDWERLHQLRPNVMVIFQSPDRVPAGLKQKADELGVKLVNVRTETLDDIFTESRKLGGLVGETAKADAAIARTQARLDAVRQRVAGKPKVRTLIAREAGGSGVVGRDNFINDLLEIAGGENVITTPGWPNIDGETLVSLKPDAVIHLLSGEPEHVLAEARAFWKSQPNVPAERNGRVYYLNEWYSQVPGSHVAELAEKMADALHPLDTKTTSAADGPKGTP